MEGGGGVVAAAVRLFGILNSLFPPPPFSSYLAHHCHVRILQIERGLAYSSFK